MQDISVSGSSSYISTAERAIVRNAEIQGNASTIVNGTAIGTIVNSGCQEYVDNGFSESATIKSGGTLHLKSYGRADAPTIKAGAAIFVSGASGSLTNLIMEDGIYVNNPSGVFRNGNFTVQANDVEVLIWSGNMMIAHSDSMAGMTLSRGTSQWIFASGSAVSTTVNGGASQWASGGFNDSVVVNSEGNINQTGGIVQYANVNSSGYLYCTSCIVVSAAIARSGRMRCFSATASHVVDNGYLEYQDGAIDDLVIGDNASCNVSSGAVANSVQMGGSVSCRMTVAYGGTALGIAIASGGSLYINGNSAVGDGIELANGRLYVSNNARAESVALHSSGRMTVDYYASDIHVAIETGASCYCGYSTYSEDVDVASGGIMCMDSMANASGIYISSGASLYVGEYCSAFHVNSCEGAIVTTGYGAYIESEDGTRITGNPVYYE